MDWIRKYRFKTLEELEPYRKVGSTFYCGNNTFIHAMYDLCGLPLSNFHCDVRIDEEKFKSGGMIGLKGMWHITYEMVVEDIVEKRKRKLNKLWK
jgi:hypothetical protein